MEINTAAFQNPCALPSACEKPQPVLGLRFSENLRGFPGGVVFNDSMNDSHSDDLAAKLRAWKVEPQASASFQREVWQRIAARQAARDDAFWVQVKEWFATQLARPRYAVPLVALSLSLSVGTALLQAQDANARHWKKLEARYASSIDPIEMGR
jgi:hypothetical protein